MLQQVDLPLLLEESRRRVWEYLRKEEFLNATQERSFQAFAQLAESRGCKAGSLNYLLLVTVLSSQTNMTQRVCRGHAFMSEPALRKRISPEVYDECSPFYALPLGRIDFPAALDGRWPTFLLLQLLSERWAATHPSAEACDIYQEERLTPNRLLGIWPQRLPGIFKMCFFSCGLSIGLSGVMFSLISRTT